MGKVIRSDRKGVQRIRARDIVPGDIVEVAGTLGASFHYVMLVSPSLSVPPSFWLCAQSRWLSDSSKSLQPKPCWTAKETGPGSSISLRDHSSPASHLPLVPGSPSGFAKGWYPKPHSATLSPQWETKYPLTSASSRSSLPH